MIKPHTRRIAQRYLISGLTGYGAFLLLILFALYALFWS